MPKRSKKRLPMSANEQQPTEAANADLELPTTTEGKNPAAVELGRLGGLKGGKARAAKLTKEQRSEIAKKAAQARWGRKKG